MWLQWHNLWHYSKIKFYKLSSSTKYYGGHKYTTHHSTVNKISWIAGTTPCRHWVCPICHWSRAWDPYQNPRTSPVRGSGWTMLCVQCPPCNIKQSHSNKFIQILTSKKYIYIYPFQKLILSHSFKLQVKFSCF